jgi:hypothetical protein
VAGVLLKRSRWHEYYRQSPAVRGNSQMWRPKLLVLDDDPHRPLRYTALSSTSSASLIRQRSLTASAEHAGCAIDLSHASLLTLSHHASHLATTLTITTQTTHGHTATTPLRRFAASQPPIASPPPRRRTASHDGSTISTLRTAVSAPLRTVSEWTKLASITRVVGLGVRRAATFSLGTTHDLT